MQQALIGYLNISFEGQCRALRVDRRKSRISPEDAALVFEQVSDDSEGLFWARKLGRRSARTRRRRRRGGWLTLLNHL